VKGGVVSATRTHHAIRGALSLGVEKHPGGLVIAVVHAYLPGAENFEREFRGDVNQPEEASSFYDDVLHAARAEYQLFCLVLEDLSFSQPRLF
jgi:hypothetical protein